MTKIEKINIFTFLIFLLIAVLGGYLALYSMKWGPWAFSDSSAYISAARNFATGDGFVIFESTGNIKSLTEFPPFYPIILSILGGSNLDFINTIRWLNIILFSLSILIFSFIFYTATKSTILSVLAAIFFTSFDKIISTFTSAMSEPLFLFLLISSLLFFILLLRNSKRIFLISFIVISALLPITRYAGLLFVVVYGISLFILLKGFPLLKRFRLVSFYYLFSFIPISIWGYSLMQNFSKFGGKRFTVDFTIFTRIINSFVEEFNIILKWIPYFKFFDNSTIARLMIAFSCILFCFLTLFILLRLFQKNNPKQVCKKALFLFSFLSIGGYFIFIGLTHSITIPQIDIIDRMMIPIYPFMIFIIFLFIEILIKEKKDNYYLSIILLSISIIFIRFNILKSNVFINNMKLNGYGFTSREYQQSGIIQAIRHLPPNQIMVSNSAGFVLFYANRYPIENMNFPNHTFGLGESYGEKLFRNEKAALILLFSDFSNYYNDPSGIFLNNLIDTLRIEYEDKEGGIYFFPTPPETTQP